MDTNFIPNWEVEVDRSYIETSRNVGSWCFQYKGFVVILWEKLSTHIFSFLYG